MRGDIIGTDQFSNGADIARRDFLKLLGTSLALASTGCSGPPPEHIVPYAHMPENILPGEPIYYATAFMCDGFAHGVLVENNDGRPIKVEGNPHHPASLGSSNAFAQASIYQLWDPDRSQIIRLGDAMSSWNNFIDAFKPRALNLMRNGGAGLHMLSGPITSPTALAQLQRVVQRYPRATLHIHDPIANHNAIAGTQRAFGRYLDSIYHFDRAATVVSFDHDFLAYGPAHIRHARDFSTRRQPNAEMMRLYTFETMPNLTGAMADHRAAFAPADQERLLWRLAQTLGVSLPNNIAQEIVKTTTPSWWHAMCADLNNKRGASLIVAGPTLPPNAHALAHKLNEMLGNYSRTVEFVEPVALTAAARGREIDAQGFDDLIGALMNGAVDTLLVFDNNAVYTEPNSAFPAMLQRAPCSIHLGLYRDETAQACTWHIPAAHNYEMWSDARAFDGSANIIQPLMAPLYAGKTVHELLALLLDSEGGAFDTHKTVRNYWRTQFSSNAQGFDKYWSESLRQGVIANSAFPAQRVAAATPPAQLQLQRTPMTLILAPDPCIHDGSFANNAWLQELPKPFTKLTWNNALAVSPKTAHEFGIANGDIVELRTENSILQAPAIIQPLHAENTCSLTLGYGRWAAGRIGDRLGVNAYELFSRATPWQLDNVFLRKTSAQHALAIRQQHDTMEQRPLVQTTDLNTFLQKASSANFHDENHASTLPSLYPDAKTEFKTEGYQWGMAIDLNACIGCNTCVIACQAENNIPVVGAEEVSRGHSMHWLRIDRYYENETTLWQPVPCMHCENAPCEAVCPVGATVHDSEGLNVQVYNRCIGTRFCSNNCPYKVRRFNFFQYSEIKSSETESSDQETLAVKARQNPDVTVRQRGVMEKCSYCLQRITRARLEAEKQNRELRDGEVVTACQGACPTRAITFGDTADITSAVSREKQSPRHYTLLEELNTRPRTTYLARVINNNSTRGGDDAV